MNIVDRVKNILLTPKTEWPVIEGESSTPQQLYTNYACILAAIPAIATFVGMSLVGYSVFGKTFRTGIGAGLGQMITYYVLSLVAVFLWALVVDALAPTFNGQKSQINALKLVVYSATASWLAGIFSLLPALALLGILGLYSLYLFYVGAPVLMKVPQEKALAYTAVCVVVGIIIMIIVGVISSAFVPNPGMSLIR
jgi:hypothetical protein